MAPAIPKTPFCKDIQQSKSMTIHHGDYRRVLRKVSADLIFTSPPYNIGSKGRRKDGNRKFGKYDPKSFGAITDYPDKKPELQYQQEQADFLIWCADHLKADGVLVYNHKPRRRDGAMIHPSEWFLRPAVRDRLVLMEEIIWNRGSTHNHCLQLMWPQTERLYVFRKPGDRYQLRNDKYSDVWNINPEKLNIGHNAPFPTELAMRVIELWSKPNDTVCDPYSGSGTTAAVAMKMGRQFEGAEILAKYHKLANERIAA
jgi:DNA modification methylase